MMVDYNLQKETCDPITISTTKLFPTRHDRLREFVGAIKNKSCHGLGPKIGQYTSKSW